MQSQILFVCTFALQSSVLSLANGQLGVVSETFKAKVDLTTVQKKSTGVMPRPDKVNVRCNSRSSSQVSILVTITRRSVSKHPKPSSRLQTKWLSSLGAFI